MAAGVREQSEPVLIAGAGPTGATLALLLARLAIPVTVLEQNVQPQQHPAACILNTRTMEIFRLLGVADEIHAGCQDVFDQGQVTWVVSLAGRELGRLRVVPEEREDLLRFSPEHTLKFSQHKLEPLLRARLERNPLIDFRPGRQVTGLRQDCAGVTMSVFDRANSSEGAVRGSYLIGCDGASSAVRKCLGVGIEGPVLQHMIGIHFRADLGVYTEGRPSILYWILNPKLAGVLIAHWLPTEWVLFAPYFPPQQSPADYTEAVCLDMIATAVGARRPDIEIKHVRPWTLAGRLASRFQAGRVFLAGDAAHSFPPTGGLGLNTGVQDAHNLAWKLAFVLKGQADPKLLKTYECERRPVARVNLDHSVRNFHNMNALTRLAGLDFRRLAIMERIQNSFLFRGLPQRWQAAAVRTAIALALGQLRRLDAPDVRGAMLRRQFRELLPGQEPHYRFLGLDLGFAYAEGAVIGEPGIAPRPADPVMDYLPTTWPGARLPHLWLDDRSGRHAVHDLVTGGEYLLLVHAAGMTVWKEAGRTVQQEYSVPLRLLAIDSHRQDHRDAYSPEWDRLSEVNATGAVLVRPDGHVAWRCQEAPGDPGKVLREVFARLSFIHTPGGEE